MTFKNRKELLTVLESPEVPLHNNGSGQLQFAKAYLKGRSVMEQDPILEKAAWENMLSILDTCRKQKVGLFKYVRDIYSNDFCMPRLADLLAKAEVIDSSIEHVLKFDRVRGQVPRKQGLKPIICHDWARRVRGQVPRKQGLKHIDVSTSATMLSEGKFHENKD